MRYFCVEHRYTLPYRPQANGIVERANGEILRHLKSIIFDKRVRNTWSVYLPLVQHIINFSYHESIGTFPAKVIYGDRVSPYRGLLTSWPESQEVKNLHYHDYVKQLNSQLRDIVAASQRHLQRKIDERKRESPEEPTIFEVGSYVLVSYPEQAPDKLMATWRGPYLVVRRDNQTYYCRDMITGVVTPFFIDRLKVYFASNELSNEEVALRDKDEYYVDKILEYQGNPKRKKTLRFKVRWLGYSDEDDSWEPYASVRECKALELFIEEHPELKVL